MHENELRVLRKGFARVMRAEAMLAALHLEADGPGPSEVQRNTVAQVE